MSLPQQKFREIVFQLLYSRDLGCSDDTVMTELMMGELTVSKKNVKLAQERMNSILKEIADIDSKISAISTGYDFERIHTVTKNILRLAVYELFFDPAIPPKVAIAEAIRLSRKFNTPESAAFVNAILDHLYREKCGEKVDRQQIEKLKQEMAESENMASKVVADLPNLKKDHQHDHP